MRYVLITVLLPLASATAALAQSTPAEPAPGVPVLSSDAGWVSGFVWLIAAAFIAAALIGPIYRSIVVEEPPPADAHATDTHEAHDHPAPTAHH